ncbi:hypothetical protein ABIB62_001283 [Mucilaginibacter sp. UYP25]|uniref:hypothetical protein n=1 Tax=unclassified Mucilaginibacter TaxID=2617802 RepID=UPI003391D4D2
MKKALLVVAVIACLASCKKDHPALSPLNGTWELRSVSGGFGPAVVVEADKRVTYQFTINSKYLKTDAAKTETRGEYRLNLTDEYKGYKIGSITFTNPDYTDAFAVKADTINIGSSAADGPTYQFIRIKK